MKFLMLLTLILVSFSCGNSGEQNDAKTKKSKSKAASVSSLGDFELLNGIGPVKTDVTLGEINQKWVTDGKAIFEQNCSACHKTSERYVGPQLDDMLTRRTPAYMMNMILNPEEMIKKHPEAKKMFAQFLTPMPFQNVTVDQARSIVEYIRTVQK